MTNLDIGTNFKSKRTQKAAKMRAKTVISSILRLFTSQSEYVNRLIVSTLSNVDPFIFLPGLVICLGFVSTLVIIIYLIIN